MAASNSNAGLDLESNTHGNDKNGPDPLNFVIHMYISPFNPWTRWRIRPHMYRRQLPPLLTSNTQTQDQQRWIDMWQEIDDFMIQDPVIANFHAIYARFVFPVAVLVLTSYYYYVAATTILHDGGYSTVEWFLPIGIVVVPFITFCVFKNGNAMLYGIRTHLGQWTKTICIFVLWTILMFIFEIAFLWYLYIGTVILILIVISIVGCKKLIVICINRVVSSVNRKDKILTKVYHKVKYMNDEIEGFDLHPKLNYDFGTIRVDVYLKSTRTKSKSSRKVTTTQTYPNVLGSQMNDPLIVSETWSMTENDGEGIIVQII
jgi:hypothetical protein